MIKISIITPVLNGEKFIEKTIKSVINQSYENLEYIIVDGFSTDNTMKIINKYKDKITHVIQKKDRSMYEALETGFDIATGDYYYWLNSDDELFDNNSIERLMNLLKKKKYDWVTGVCSIIHKDNERPTSYIPLAYPKTIIANGLAHNCYWGFIQQENTVFSKKIYKEVGKINKNFKMAGDFDLWRRMAKKYKLYSINVKIGSHRISDNQLTDLDYYYNEIEQKKCVFNPFYLLRFIFSILSFPIIYFRK